MIHQLYRRAVALLNMNNDSADAHARRVVLLSQRQGYSFGQARGYVVLAAAFRNKAQFDSSIFYAQQALTLFESQNRPDGIAGVYNVLATTYKRMGDAQKVKLLTQKALQYAHLARQFALQSRSYSELSRSFNTLGITYRDLGRMDSAKAYYQRAIRVEQRYRPVPSYLPVSYANYGQAVMDADKNYELAIHYYRQAIPLYRQQQNLTGQEHAYRNLSWAYRQQGNHQQAIIAAEQALALGRAVNDPHRLLNSLEAAYLAYREAGQYKRAIALLEEQKNREDSLVNIDKTRAITSLEATYRSEKQELRIHQLAEDRTRDRRQMALLGVGMGVLLLLLGGLFYQYQAVRKGRAKIRQQSDQLSLMIRELHHRVKNNLAIVSSLLRLQASQLPDERIAGAIRTGQQRVEAMALIHQRLYHTDNLTTVNVREYLTDLIDSLRNAYGYAPNEIDVVLDIRKEWLDVDIAVPLGLIVNELVTNSFKHAFPLVDRPALRVCLYEDNGLHLDVQDNGPGIVPANWQHATEQSFGRQLIASLCRQLKGVLEVKQQHGALFQMRFSSNS